MAKSGNKRSVDVSKRYNKNQSHGAASKFGQLIGLAFAKAVMRLIQSYLRDNNLDYELKAPDDGKLLLRLEMAGGTLRETDNVIVPSDSDDPIAILESKWLKDGRHHNDKGAWILQMREIKKKLPTIRGAVANVLGYWTEGIHVMIEREGKVKMVWVATDENVYATLQPHLDKYTESIGEERRILDAVQIRGSMPEPWLIANFLSELTERGDLDYIADEWFEYERETPLGDKITGRTLVTAAIDDILKPPLAEPAIEKFEIALQVNTGNVIYKEFTDMEEIIQFITDYANNPDQIIDTITPRKRPQAKLF